MDQSLFAAPHGLSQRTTSFIASQRQGIHQIPLRHLIALIIGAHPGRARKALPARHRRSGTVGDGAIKTYASEPVRDGRRSRLPIVMPRVPGAHSGTSHDAPRRTPKARGGVDPSVRSARQAAPVVRPQSRSAGHIHSSRCRTTRPVSTGRCASRRGRWRILVCGRGGRSEAVPIRPSRLAPPPKRWWSKTGSNRRPHACKARALPTELLPLRRKLALSTEGQPSASNAGADFRRLGSRHGARRPVGLADAGRVGQRRHADWWAWEDSNFRPHAYQARALTN